MTDKYATVEDTIKSLSKFPKDYFVTTHDYEPVLIIMARKDSYRQVGTVPLGADD